MQRPINLMLTGCLFALVGFCDHAFARNAYETATLDGMALLPLQLPEGSLRARFAPIASRLTIFFVVFSFLWLLGFSPVRTGLRRTLRGKTR